MTTGRELPNRHAAPDAERIALILRCDASRRAREVEIALSVISKRTWTALTR
jgi:hypothetical protein